MGGAAAVGTSAKRRRTNAENRRVVQALDLKQAEVEVLRRKFKLQTERRAWETAERQALEVTGLLPEGGGDGGQTLAWIPLGPAAAAGRSSAR